MSEKLENIIKNKEIELENLSKLKILYPDLEIFEGRWKKIVYCSKSINHLVNFYDIRHNCGCCNDSPLEIWPFIETEFGLVYSSPARFTVGEKDPYTYCDKPYNNWQNEFIKNNINQIIIDKISSYFEIEEEKIRNYESDDD